jgi:hypothetical protein
MQNGGGVDGVSWKLVHEIGVVEAQMACHLKNYSFVITYLLKDEQELSLGMFDMSQMYL